MKKIIILVMALLSLGIAMPTSKAQTINDFPCLTDIHFESSCAKINHPIQEIREVYIDVCAKPKRKLNLDWKAPKVSFSREAMVFNTINFVIAPYDKGIDNSLREWDLQIDFGNGVFSTIPSSGTTITMTFPPGAKPVFKYKAWVHQINPLSNDNKFSDEKEKEFFIKSPTNPDYQNPDKIWKINAGNYTPPAYASQSYQVGSNVLNAGDAKGLAYIKLGAGHTQISKPIIFVDGVDFESTRMRFEDKNITLSSNYESKIVRCGVTGWDLFSMGAEDSWLDPALTTETYREYPAMFDNLRAQGYDIIFLDFEEGSTFIQKNAMVLKALINRINASKVADVNGMHENVVLGASMGGQVARMALAQMERDNQPHCTRMYVSFDSPQKGAYIPLALQGLSYMFKDLQPENWENINQPAAKQMLTETLPDAVLSGKINASITFNGLQRNHNFKPNTLRAAFVQEMKDLDYPKLTQNIAIVDGDVKGTNVAGDPTASQPSGVPFPNNATILKVDASTFGTPLISAQLNALNGSFPTPPFPVPPLPNGTLFDGKIPNLCVAASLPGSTYNVQFRRIQGLPNFDNAPGCIRGDMRGLRRQLNDLQKDIDDITGNFAQLSFPANQFQPNFCFMTTVSTLDIRNPNNPNQWNWYTNPNILGVKINELELRKINTHLTPFFDYYAPQKNIRHVEVDGEMRAWVKQYMIDTDKEAFTFAKVLPYNGFTSYNYSYRKNRISTVTVNIGGILKVNDIGNSAFNNPSSLEKNNYEAQLGDGCAATTVTINGGSFLLGSPTDAKKSAALSTGKGNKIIMNSGVIDLYNNSKLIIEAGSLLHIKAGILRVLDNSQIIVQEGGKLIIEPDVMVVLNNSALTTSSEARIVIEERGTLQLTGINQDGYNFNFDGNGHFAFGNGNILKMEDLNNNPVDFRWLGTGKNLRMIKLDDATIDIPERNVSVKSAAIEYNGASMIHMNKGQSLTLADVKAYVPANGKTLKQATAFKIQEGEGTIIVRSSTFSGFNIGIDIFAEEETVNKITSYKTSHNYNIYVNVETVFENCNVGTNILNNQGRVTFSNNVTYRNNKVGVFIDSNTKTVLFNACVFDHNGIGSMIKRMPYKGSVTYSNTTMDKNVHGSVLYQIKSAVYKDCKILNHNEKNNDNSIQNSELLGYDATKAIGTCDIDFMCGILDLYNSNIVATQGTQFLNNNFGIYKYVNGVNQKNDPMGPDAVVLDCVTFDNNKYAVKGQDLIMQNDALFSQPSLNYPVRSNNFVQNKEGVRLFDITYTGKAQIVPNLIQMRNNYWQTKLNIGAAPDPMTISFNQKLVTNGGISATDCEHCNTTNSCINYETAPELDDLIKECPFITYPDPDPKANVDLFDKINDNCKCNVAVSENANGASNNVHAQYRMAYAYLVSEKNPDVDKAMALFTPIALLPIAGNEQSTACDHYIRMARAFTDIYPNGNDTEIQTLSRVQKTRAVIYPNPTDNFFNINLEKGAYAISIVDMQGRVVYQQNTEGNLEVETEKWLSGVYQIFIKNKNTGTETTEKVVVMRY
jgi:hypothetical protein